MLCLASLLLTFLVSSTIVQAQQTDFEDWRGELREMNPDSQQQAFPRERRIPYHYPGFWYSYLPKSMEDKQSRSILRDLESGVRFNKRSNQFIPKDQIENISWDKKDGDSPEEKERNQKLWEMYNIYNRYNKRTVQFNKRAMQYDNQYIQPNQFENIAWDKKDGEEKEYNKKLWEMYNIYNRYT